MFLDLYEITFPDDFNDLRILRVDKVFPIELSDIPSENLKRFLFYFYYIILQKPTESNFFKVTVLQN